MFTKAKGCLFLAVDPIIIAQYVKDIPEQWKTKQQERDNGYHMTIVTSQEMQETDLLPLDTNFDIVGLKILPDVAFLVVHYPAGDKYRKMMELQNKDFHITVGFANKDNHEINKSIKCLRKEEIVNLAFFKNKTLKEKQYEIMCHMYYNFPDNIDVLKKYAESTFSMGLENNTIALCHEIMELDVEEGVLLLLKIMVHLKRMDFAIANQIVDKLEKKNASKKSEEIVNIINKYLEKSYLCIRNSMYTKIKRPRNFSQVFENLYGSAIVTSEHIDFLDENKITVIINLMEKHEKPFESKLTEKFGKKYHNIEIVDRSIPTPKQMLDILDIISESILNGENVVVHCLGGKGRTNTIIACYLMKEQGMKYTDISEMMHRMREVAFSDEQITLMKNFNCKRSHRNIKNNGKSAPKMLVMIGLPASGKSTLSNHLCEYVENVVRANQDDHGRQDMLKLISDNMSGTDIVIVDRCNITSTERKEFTSYLKMNQKAWAIVFNIPIDECIYRAQKRENHPTLKQESAERIITEISTKMEPLAQNEGFDNVITISSSDDLNFILRSWNLPEINIEYDMELMKFPRTHHLYNLGSATREDLILSQNEQQKFLNVDVVIEEKIDGANFGISIDPDSFKIMYQNRSHYVTAGYATQFKLLDTWESEYSADIFNAITPGRHILFGEWLFAKHSIHYTNLPGYFVAFDIFDKQIGKFVSRTKMEEMLKDTKIPIIHKIAQGKYKDAKEIAALVNTKSNYYNDKVEGVYVRICEGDYTVARAKIVRSDFLCGNQEVTGKFQHWASRELTRNVVPR